MSPDDLFNKTIGDAASRGNRSATSHDVWQMLSEFKKFKTRETRVAFADSWLKTCASYFEEMWPATYELLRIVDEDKLYQDPRTSGGRPGRIPPDAKGFASFKDYFEARLKRPFETWFELERTHHYVSNYAPELINKTFGEAQAALAAANQAANAKDLANQQEHPHGGAREGAGRPRKDQQDNFKRTDTKNDGPLEKSREGKDLRRLRKDSPDIHKRVMAGEITAHAGMVEAGFRKKRPSKKLLPVDKIRREIPKLSEDQLRSLIDELNSILEASTTTGA